MKKSWKSQIARATGNNYNLNKKVLQLKKSWDVVEGILNNSMKKKKKK